MKRATFASVLFVLTAPVFAGTRLVHVHGALSIAEMSGHAVHVSMSCYAPRLKGIAEREYDLAPGEQRLIKFSEEIGPVDATVTVSGDGNVLLSTQPAAVIEDIVAAPFKAAPFQDPDTGLIYMRDRWYDPRTGTFLTPDPEGYADSSNLYTYCHGDPVNCSDPTGRLDPSVREDFRRKEREQIERRAAEWCRAHPVECKKRDVRGGAIFRVVGGVTQTTAGVAAILSTGPVPEPATKTIGGTAVIRGIDNTLTGAIELWTGEQRDTVTGRAFYLALVKSGVSPARAAKITGWTEVGVDLASTIGSGIATSLRAPALPANIARSFSNGSYVARVLERDITVYRAEGNALGRWFGTVKPSSAAEAERLYNAVDYGNDLTRVASYRIPKGTLVYEGQVAGGSGTQLYLADPRTAGLRLLSSEPLPQYGH